MASDSFTDPEAWRMLHNITVRSRIVKVSRAAAVNHENFFCQATLIDLASMLLKHCVSLDEDVMWSGGVWFSGWWMQTGLISATSTVLWRDSRTWLLRTLTQGREQHAWWLYCGMSLPLLVIVWSSHKWTATGLWTRYTPALNCSRHFRFVYTQPYCATLAY